jgi:hypothetical protein
MFELLDLYAPEWWGWMGIAILGIFTSLVPWLMRVVFRGLCQLIPKLSLTQSPEIVSNLIIIGILATIATAIALVFGS